MSKKLSIKKVDRKVPTHNYFIVMIVAVLTIVVMLYIRSFYLSYQVNKINDSVFFDKSINQVNTEDLSFTLSETTDAILYVSYTGSEEIYDMEKKLYKQMKKDNLIDKVIYWNITDIRSSNEYIRILKEKFPSISSEISSAPLLIYIYNGEPVEAMSSELKVIDYKVFDKMVDKYEIE